jgi:hypothetical protein
LHGHLVAATFLIDKPSYTLRGRTILGAADRDDGVERGAVMKGNWLKLEGRVTVIGVLRAIDHPPAFVNQVFVPAWVEMRVDAG